MPVLPAHRQAAPAPGHRGGDPVQAGPAPALRHDRRRDASQPEPARAAHPARRGHLAALPRQGARARSSTCAPVSMDFAYGSSFLRGSPGGLRAAAARRPARRLDAVRALGRGGAGLGDHRRADRRVGRPTPAGFPNYEAGIWGPAEADAPDGARRPRVEAPVSAAPRPCARDWDGRGVTRGRGGRPARRPAAPARTAASAVHAVRRPEPRRLRGRARPSSTAMQRGDRAASPTTSPRGRSCSASERRAAGASTPWSARAAASRAATTPASALETVA